MPISEAWRRCPKAVYLRPRMRLYAEVSKRVRSIFERFTDLIEPISIDEAFLDVTASTNLFGPAEKIGRDIKQQVKDQTQLTASVGIAPNKFLAKFSSDLEKPDGLVVFPREAVPDLLWPQPIEGADVVSYLGIVSGSATVSTMPPMIDGSTTTLRVTCLPVALARAAFTSTPPRVSSSGSSSSVTSGAASGGLRNPRPPMSPPPCPGSRTIVFAGRPGNELSAGQSPTGNKLSAMFTPFTNSSTVTACIT